MKRDLDEPLEGAASEAKRTRQDFAWEEAICKLEEIVSSSGSDEVVKLQQRLHDLLFSLKKNETSERNEVEPAAVKQLLQESIYKTRQNLKAAGGVHDKFEFLKLPIPLSSMVSQVMSSSIKDHTNDYYNAKAVHWDNFFVEVRRELKQSKRTTKEAAEKVTRLPPHSPFMALPIFREIDLHCICLYLLSVCSFLVAEDTEAEDWSESLFFWTSRVPNSMMDEKQIGYSDCSTYAMRYAGPDSTFVFHGGACVEIKTLESLTGSSWEIHKTDAFSWGQIMGYLRGNCLRYGILTNIAATWFLFYEEETNTVKISDPIYSQPTDPTTPTLLECLYVVTRLSAKAVFAV